MTVRNFTPYARATLPGERRPIRFEGGESGCTNSPAGSGPLQRSPPSTSLEPPSGLDVRDRSPF